MKNIYILILIVFNSSAFSANKAQLNAEPIFCRANKLYRKADETALKNPDKARTYYRKAASYYKILADSGIACTPAVMLNLGNAYYFSGDLGRAILSYRKGLILDPANDDLNHNLKVLKTECIDDVPDSTTKTFFMTLLFLNHFSLKTKIIIFSIVYSFAWVLLGIFLFRKNKRLKIAAVSLFMLSAVFAFSICQLYSGFFSHTDGVITAKETGAYKGAGYIYSRAFLSPLHAGTEFKLLETQKNWYKIALNDGRRCWIPTKNASLIFP